MMKKRLVCVLLPALAIVLELLPWSAVLLFAPSPSQRVRRTCSYFSLTPFGYGNFGPLITAVLSCALLAAAIWAMIRRRSSRVLFPLSLLALIASLLPLLMGVPFYGAIGAVISVLLALEVWAARAGSKASN